MKNESHPLTRGDGEENPRTFKTVLLVSRFQYTAAFDYRGVAEDREDAG